MSAKTFFAIMAVGAMSLQGLHADGGASGTTVDFRTEILDGWTVENGEYRSPQYANAVDRIELSYTGVVVSASAAVYATANEGVETQIATFNAASSAASFNFPDETDFRSFRIVATNGLELSLFTAYVSSATLDAPSNVAISNNITGTSFDAYWNPVDGATSYKAYVWTNAVVGASMGTEVWKETMPGATNASSSTKLTDAKFTNCFEKIGWTRSNQAGYPTGEDGTIRIGITGDNGWLQTPPINESGDGMAVRFFAKANATNTKSMDIAVERVSGETVTLAGSATLTTEMQEFTIALPEWESGDCIRFNSITNGDRRTVIGTVKIVSGYSAGHEEPAYIDGFDGLDVGNTTSYTFTELPSVPVFFAIEAYGKRGVKSSLSAVQTVDLSNPDKVAVLNACPMSSLMSSAHTYTQNFDSLASITATTGDKEWLNGTTLEYWQAYRKTAAVTSISHNTGGANSGGLYALATNINSSARALGGLRTSTDAMSWGMAFTNDTGNVVSLSSIEYVAQQWGTRNTVDHNMTLTYLVTDELKWMCEESEGWSDPVCTTTATGEDPETTPVSTTISYEANGGIVITPGQVLYLKWTVEKPDSGSAAMMGIDDVVVTFSVSPPGLSIHIANNN